MKAAVLISIALLGLGSRAGACTALEPTYFRSFGPLEQIVGDVDVPRPKTGYFPTTFGAYCAFVYSGEYDFGYGTFAVPIGHNRTLQILSSGSACDAQTAALISDCDTGKHVTLLGNTEPSLEVQPDGKITVDAGYSRKLIEPSLAPRGPLDIFGAQSLDALVADAEGLGLVVVQEDGFEDYAARAFQGDVIDPLCGCKVHFPASKGATQ